MIDIIQSLIIGAVQGISEFLPISSSGHLVFIHQLLKWDQNGRLAFDIALHFGTAIAIIVYFWRDWLEIIVRGVNPKAKLSKTIDYDRELDKYPKNLLWQLLVASVPAAIVGLLLNDYVETKLDSVLLISFNLIVFGLILWYSDKISNNDFKPGKLSYKQTFIVGLSQAVALMPGVSRSGITITSGRLLGMNRESAARFSFLLSTPAILGAFLLNFRHIKEISVGPSFWTGVIASTIFGFLAIKYLLQYLKRSDFAVFLWYRIAVAVIVIGIYLAH